MAKKSDNIVFLGTGRRKKSIARVRLVEAKVTYVNGKISRCITTVYGETGQATIIYEFGAENIKVLETKYSYKSRIEEVDADADLSLDYQISYLINYDGKVVGSEAPEHIDIFQEFQRVVPFVF